MKVIVLTILVLCNTLSASANVVCEEDDTLIPNPEDCNSFYNCDNGIPILIPCPPTLHFNPEALVCDLPENVDCTANPSTTTTEKATTTSTAKPTTSTTTEKATTTTTEQATTTTEEATTTTTTTTTEAPTTTTTTEQPTTTTTTEGSTSTSEQPSQSTCPPTGSDVIPNPNDCSSFLVCIDGHNTTVSCPSGMLYNDDIKTCDKAENVECNVKTSSTAPETTTTTTEKQTTTTTTDRPTTTTTPEQSTSTTEQVTSTSTTEKVSSTTEQVTSTSTTEKVTSTTEEATSTTEQVTSTTEISTSTTDESTSTTDQSTNTTTTEQPGFEPECPEEGFAIVENPESCSSFYVCVNGNYGLVQCPPDLDYNPATIRCDLPANPQCRAGTTLPPPPYVPPCPENGTVQLPDPSDCGSFYICINGNYAQLSCPDDFEFNVTSQSCVHPQQSTCNAMKTYQLSFECEEDGTFPDPEDCSKYIVCVGNQINHMECPGGLHFDVSLSTCNTPDEAQCEIGTTSSPTTETTTEVTTTSSTPAPTIDDTTTTTEITTTSTTTTKSTTDGTGNEPNCPDEGTAILPDPENCNQFFICIEGSFDVVDCPDGYAFNEELGRCDLAENVDCNAGTPAPHHPDCPAEGSAKLPNPDDCGSYFFCLNGESALIECPDGLNYDAEKEVCSATATCSNESSTSSTSTNTAPTVSEEPTSTTTTSKPTDPEEPSSTTTTTKPTDNPSECSEEGKLEPNPDDCSTFFQCANGVLVELQCPPGLVFNAESLVCDLPSQANCSESKKVKSLFSFLKFWNKF